RSLLGDRGPLGRLDARSRLRQLRDGGAPGHRTAGTRGDPARRRPKPQDHPLSASRMTPTQRVRPARTERGSVILFVVALLGTALAFGGWAIDMSYWALVRKELLRTVEASSLAAAGNLWFDATVFPGVRSAAQTYGTLNPYSGGTVTLGANSGN